MKKLSIALISILLGGMLFFLGCPPEELYEPTDDEVSTIATASFGSVVIAMELLGGYSEDPGSFSFPGISITISGENVIFTFTNCEMDLDEVEGTDLTLNGTMTLSGDDSNFAYTYTNMRYQGIMPGTDYTIDITISGTVTVDVSETDATYLVEFELSGATDDPVDVLIELIGTEGPPSVDSASINGYDFTSEFTTIMSTMFSK